LKVTSAESKDQILSKVMKELIGKELGPSGLLLNDCVEAVRNNASVVFQMSKGDEQKVAKYTPIVIFDVERAGSTDQVQGVQAVRSIAKKLAQYCYCFVVLSEANAILQFGRDRRRERYVLVGDFSEEEAVDFLQKLDSKLDLPLSENHVALGKDLRYVFDTVGAHPATMLNLHDSESPVADFVTNLLAEARLDLVAFPHQAILKALKEHPGGVEPEYFKKQKDEGVDLSDPHAVGVAMKHSNAILYDMKERKYKVMSKAHAMALSNYEPGGYGMSTTTLITTTTLMIGGVLVGAVLSLNK
jgi:hypothetical protein